MVQRVGRLVLVVVVATVLAGTVPAGPAGADLTTPVEPPGGLVLDRTIRIGTNDPVESAVVVSQTSWASGEAELVAVVRDDVHADALAAVGLTSRGPILLTPTDGLDAAAAAEIDRALAPDGRVVLVGGEAALAPSVEETLRAQGHDVVRLAGPGRIETALAVSSFLAADRPGGRPDGRAFVVRASGPGGAVAWADAAAAAPLAASAGDPVLLVPTDHLPAAVADHLADTTDVVVVGGTAAVGLDVERALRTPARVVTRLAGAGRADTARVAAESGLRARPPSRYMVADAADAGAWRWAIPAAGLAGRGDAAVLWSLGAEVPDATAALVAACGTRKSVRTALVGGSLVVPGAVRVAVEGLDGGGCPEAPDGEPRLVAVHAVPADLEPVPGIEAAIAHEAALVDGWFGSQHPGADGLRWLLDDEGAIEVVVVLLAEPAAAVDDPFRMDRAIRAAGLGGAEDRYVVHTEAVSEPNYCASASAIAAAVMWMPTCDLYPDAATREFPDGATYVAAHEITHLLGAAPACAPNAVDFHVDDDPHDVIFGPFAMAEPIVLDVNNDDYFLHDNAGCPDIADSPFWR